MAASAKRNAKIEITAENKTGPGVNSARRELNTMRREQERANRAAAISKSRADRKAARDAERAENEAAKARKQATKGTIGVGHALGAGLVAAAGFGAVGGIEGMVSDVFDANKELVRFQIDAQLSSQQALAFNESLMRISNSTGVARKDLIEAAHAYQILTGDADGAIKSSQLFAEVANASGASMQDIAAVAGSFKQNLHLDPSQFRAAFDVLQSMGHKGSVELRDFAGELSGLAPQFSQFGAGGGVKGLTEMAAAMQVVRHGFGSASEAATGLQSLMGGIVQKSGKLEAAGVKVFTVDPKTKKRVLRDFFDIVEDMKKHGLDMKDLFKDLGRKEGVRAALELISDEGLAKMKELYATALNSDQVAKDNATYMNSSAGKLQRAWEIIKNDVAEALTPERIEAFANAMMTAAKFITDAVAAIEHFTGGDSKEEQNARANQYAQQLLDQSGAGVYDSTGNNVIQHQAEAAAIERAKRLATEDLSNPDTAVELGVAGVDSVRHAADIRAGANQFLKMHGVALSSLQGVGVGSDWGYTSNGGAAMRAGMAAQAVTPQMMRDQAVAFAQALKDIGMTIVVKADANGVATVGNNAPVNRNSPRGGR